MSPSQAPFPSSCALDLDRLSTPYPSIHTGTSPKEDQARQITYVPGEPAISLLPGEIERCLSSELETPLLDELHEQLWMVARKSGFSIDALHAQKVKGRGVVPVENPKLHLIWDREKIYIKPVPIFLLNHDFWTMYLQSATTKQEPPVANQGIPQLASSAAHRSMALGFMRSYSLLVPRRLDFILAKEAHLIPDGIDWLQWSTFISNFRHVRDEDVARRYHYGQLRLSRLNWAVRIFRPRHADTTWFYEIPHWSMYDFVARATLPLAFAFASLSVGLSSMQVVLAVPADALWFQEADGYWLNYLSRVFWVFSLGLLLLWVLVCFLLLGIPLVAILWQLQWGFRNRGRQITYISRA